MSLMCSGSDSRILSRDKGLKVSLGVSVQLLQILC